MESSNNAAAHVSGGGPLLVIMAKAPRPGAVKTRLTQNLSTEAVTAFYRCLLDDTLSLARSLTGVEVALMCPLADVKELADFAGNRASVVAQHGQGLAAGLTSVFACFAGDHPRRVIAFNSDSPHLPPAVLQNAFEILATYDMVVGPTYDGGYYLVGAKTSRPSLFADDGMSTNSALDRLLLRAKTLGLSVGFTDQFYDIDIADDLLRLAADLRASPSKAPKTARWCSDWHNVLSQLQSNIGEP